MSIIAVIHLQMLKTWKIKYLNLCQSVIIYHQCVCLFYLSLCMYLHPSISIQIKGNENDKTRVHYPQYTHWIIYCNLFFVFPITNNLLSMWNGIISAHSRLRFHLSLKINILKCDFITRLTSKSLNFISNNQDNPFFINNTFTIINFRQYLISFKIKMYLH